MNSIILSIKPEFCERIADGNKTVEVRKTKPKLETPFKCYIYETLGKKQYYSQSAPISYYEGKGKVIGEFVCDIVVKFPNDLYDVVYQETSFLAYLDEWDLATYLGVRDVGYGWHISDLVIYDKPRELSDFVAICEGLKPYQCSKCEYSYVESNESIGLHHGCGCDNLKPLKRPPQSWCYAQPSLRLLEVELAQLKTKAENL